MIEDINKKNKKENEKTLPWYSYLLGQDDHDDLMEEENKLLEGVAADKKKTRSKEKEVCTERMKDREYICIFLGLIVANAQNEETLYFYFYRSI